MSFRKIASLFHLLILTSLPLISSRAQDAIKAFHLDDATIKELRDRHLTSHYIPEELPVFDSLYVASLNEADSPKSYYFLYIIGATYYHAYQAATSAKATPPTACSASIRLGICARALSKTTTEFRFGPSAFN